jgi:hypothetical protein
VAYLQLKVSKLQSHLMGDSEKQLAAYVQACIEYTGPIVLLLSYTFTLDHALTYSKATLCAVDLHAPSPELVESWTSTQTGDDYPVMQQANAMIPDAVGSMLALADPAAADAAAALMNLSGTGHCSDTILAGAGLTVY